MTRSAWRRLALAAAALGALLLAGCGGDGRLAVSGTVKFKGEPLDQGSINFIPASGHGSEQGATIENGKYRIPRDRGLEPGTYHVRIHSYDEKGSKVPDPVPGDPGAKQFRERIHEKYNVKTTLKAEVSKDNTTFDFSVD